MLFEIDERLSDSPFVERIWRSHSERSGRFISIATSHSELVFSRYQGQITVTMRGPETRATLADCPSDAEFFGIIFKLGAALAPLPAPHLVDGATNLPFASSRSFWLNGASWLLPDYDNADAFVDRLARDGALVYEPTVADAIYGRRSDLSLRTVQRRFLQATGLTRAAVFQIERARYATSLLREGASILDTVELAGYADQPHLTRALKRLVGQTPAQIAPEAQPEQMSFLFKTEPLG